MPFILLSFIGTPPRHAVTHGAQPQTAELRRFCHHPHGADMGANIRVRRVTGHPAQPPENAR